MSSSFELLWDWGRKKMNLDEQISKRVDKDYRFELWNENVIPKTLKQNSKTPIAVMLLGFFLFKIIVFSYSQKIFNLLIIC